MYHNKRFKFEENDFSLSLWLYRAGVNKARESRINKLTVTKAGECIDVCASHERTQVGEGR